MKTTAYLIACTFIFGFVSNAAAVPLKEIEGLDSITLIERSTSNPNTGWYTHAFETDDGDLLHRIHHLTCWNNDFEGVTKKELYDVFYSDAAGVFDADGEYVSVEAVYNVPSPAGGGLNISEMYFNFAENAGNYVPYLVSFYGHGRNYIPGSEQYALDGDLQTHTTMGNTIHSGDRLRLTFGLRPGDTEIPEPASAALLGLGLLAGRKLRRKK